MKKKISVGVVVALILSLMLGSIPVLTDTYVNDKIACSTVSVSDSTGYTVGGANANSSATPDYYLRYSTYSTAEGSANAKIYNETSPVRVAQEGTSSVWDYYWSCRINVSEHNNYYGTYVTNIYRVLSNGTMLSYGIATTYVSPITITYSYTLSTQTSVTVTLTNTDATGGSIITEKYASGNQTQAYFDSGNGTAFSGTTLVFPVTGRYTLYEKDSAGYEKVLPIEVNTASGSVHLGVTQAFTTQSATPVVNVIAWCGTDVDTVVGNSNYGSPTVTQTTDSTAPESSVESIVYTSDGALHGYRFRPSNQDYENGDYVLVTFWYKTTDTTTSLVGTGSLTDSIWNALPSADADNALSTIKDGNWHFGYRIVQIQCNVSNGIFGMFAYGDSIGAQSIQFSGVHLIKIPNGSALSSGVTIKKWAYGTQTASYFKAGNGTSFSGNSFNVSQNGIVSVFAEDASDNELVRTYDVENYNQYAGDTTPPSGNYSLSTTAWTTGNVTINVTAADAQSGVKSVTLPNGTVVNSNTCSYTATSNSTYNFTLTDNAGNTCTYPVTVSNIDRSVSVSYTSGVTYSVDPNNLSNPVSAQDIMVTNNNTHVGAQVTLQRMTSALSGINGFTLGAQVEELASGTTTWSEIDNKTVQLVGGGSTVLGVLSPGGTGHIKLVGQLSSLKWLSVTTDTGNMKLTFTAVS